MLTICCYGFPIETVIIFVIMFVGAMFIDLFMHRKNELISLKNAVYWFFLWVLIAMVFNVFLYVHHGVEIASLFLTGYVFEKTMSIDNMFMISGIFSWFEVPNKYRHRVLYWGVIGAIVFRGIFVAIGTTLLKLAPYVEEAFACIIVWTAVIMLQRNKKKNEIQNYSKHLAYRIVNFFLPVWPKINSHKFILNQKEIDIELVKDENKNIIVGRVKKTKYYATLLLLCVVMIELSDLVFAFDSVPAIVAISREPLIVYSAMIFAVLGLRSLYFVLEGLKLSFIYLEKAMIFLLFFISLKLGLNSTNHHWHHGYTISSLTSLLVTLVSLAIGITLSFFIPSKRKEKIN